VRGETCAAGATLHLSSVLGKNKSCGLKKGESADDVLIALLIGSQGTCHGLELQLNWSLEEAVRPKVTRSSSLLLFLRVGRLQALWSRVGCGARSLTLSDHNSLCLAGCGPCDLLSGSPNDRHRNRVGQSCVRF